MATEKDGASGKASLGEAELEKLVRATIDGLGEVDAAELPHRIRERLKDRLGGKTDLEDVIARAIRARFRR